ncbi:MAG: FumA C-terminus/TtdB family hydratase beta subunit [Opitutales bacterium]|nr:FumA C-terminus/TtdB family hydratase beta subunit [Opitutales bacterium]
MASIDKATMFPCDPYQNVDWRKIDGLDSCLEQATFCDEMILKIKPEALERLAQEAFHDISHFLRPGHLEQLRKILDDSEASPNDRFVALDLLRNSQIAAEGILPMCQDTGTAIILAKKGRCVWTQGGDESVLSNGIEKTYASDNLRFSQLAPIGMFEEKNTRSNLPAQVDILHTDGTEYHFLFMAKGGGSANKTFLHQGTPSLLKEELLLEYLDERIAALGTAACPPYHLAVVIGGTSAEANLKTVKLASARFLDDLPIAGDHRGHAIRCPDMENKILEMTQKRGIGAQFGGKYFCLDVRVIRLPRHGASLPIGIGVSCSADRQALGKITAEGVFLEQLESNPSRFLPDYEEENQSGDKAVEIDLNMGMEKVLQVLSNYPVRTRLSLNGPLIVARDLAHSRLRDRLNAGDGLPEYFKQYPVYYAGPAKTPQGYASGSFGPTTAGRMDVFVNKFQEAGGSMVMLAKGNRSKMVVQACKKHGGFYLGSIGGSAARLAQKCIKKVDVIEYDDLGMEAIRKIEVENFPAFIITDDKGNDFFLGDSVA